MKTRKVDVQILNPDGTVVFEKPKFEVPEGWSDHAAAIVANKYATDKETSALQIIDRVTLQICLWGTEQDYFSDMDSGIEFTARLRDILVNQRASFNSPVWFNCGVPENKDQMSACFIFPVEDDMVDILEHTKREGMVFKSGSGAGVNISKLRAKGEQLSNKGFASGPVSFMKMWDACAGSVKSGGKSRRSAKLVCMDVDHPDIMEFIECKLLEEKKAVALMEAGYSAEEAYSTIAFQNANHSVRVTDEFMEAVEDGDLYDLINRGNKEVARELPAQEIFRTIAEVAWATGDPGVQFDDRMNLDNPVPSLGHIRSTNPCSEFSAIDNSSCNLASLNLVKYYNNGTFDWQLFRQDISIMITAMDILIDAAVYPTPEVRAITTTTRPLGLGFTNLGALLMLKGLSYDSQEARDTAAEITRLMTYFALMQSIELGRQLGSFKALEENREEVYSIYQRVIDDADNIFESRPPIRNSQLTLLAPTGTISFMMDCDTTGIEPLFALQATKTLAGGGTMKILPSCVRQKYVELLPGPAMAKTLTFEQFDGPQPTLQENIKRLPEEKQAIFKTANEIHWKDHIRMMAACQKHLNGAISKTINMPTDATVEDVEDAYMFAWQEGLKSVAIYRDGSKTMQPLRATKEEQEEEVEEPAEPQWQAVRRRLPTTRQSLTHKFNIAGIEGFIIPGMYEDGTLGETFLKVQKQGSTIGGLLDSFAIVLSLALQYGVPLKTIHDKLSETRFEPAGYTDNPDIRFTTSIMDYLCRYLMSVFSEDEIEDELPAAVLSSIIPPTEGKKDASGPPCIFCGNMTHKVGTCYLCNSCGQTSGCS